MPNVDTLILDELATTPAVDIHEYMRRAVEWMTANDNQALLDRMVMPYGGRGRGTLTGRWSYRPGIHDEVVFDIESSPELYGRSITHIITDELTPEVSAMPNAASACLDVSANAVPPVDARPAHDARPKLPAGIRYLFPDTDVFTVTDVPERHVHAFKHYTDSGYVYAYKELNQGEYLPEVAYATSESGLRSTWLESNTEWETKKPLYRVHIPLHPVGAGYSSGTNAHGHPFMSAIKNPWRDERWFKEHWLRWIEQMPRINPALDGTLQFFETPAKRAAGIYTSIKPGRYLSRFFKDVLSQEDIQRLGLEFENFAKPMPLKLATTADDMETLYRSKYNGSCMHFGDEHEDGDEHPARAYAAGDLAQAYIGPLTSAAGRCLVWPSKNIYYPKFYGDRERMEAALVAAGYTSADEEEFYGAKLQRIEHGCGERHRIQFITPYLDVGGYVRDMGDHLVITHEDDEDRIGSRETNGLSDYAYKCAHSGRPVSGDNLYHIDGVGYCHADVVRNSGDFFECDFRVTYYRNEDMVDCAEGLTLSQDAVDHYQHWANFNYRLCEGTGLWHRKMDTVVLSCGTVWSEDYAQEHGHCDDEGVWHSEPQNPVDLDQLDLPLAA